jgi:hypothetical protein
MHNYSKHRAILFAKILPVWGQRQFCGYNKGFKITFIMWRVGFPAIIINRLFANWRQR